MTRTVLITGAGRGIGFELARQCALRGDAVLGTARSPEGRAAIDRLRSVGDVTSFGADVTDAGRLGELAHMLSDRSVDLLICNAGALIGRGGIEDPAITPAAFQTVLMTNVAGPLLTVRAFLPHLRRSAAGKVAVLTSSMGSSTRARGSAYMYRASKAAATNLALNLAAELSGMGIAVGAWHPGWVRTEMGGPEAEIDATDSVKGLLARFDALSLATTGVVEDHAGAAVPI
jgi:NAD(P)-dependent dehydrogenase (short-subunit alcohol dehydrogenase family)